MSDRIDIAIKIDERRRDRTESAVFAALAVRPAPRVVEPRGRRWLAVPAIAAAMVIAVVAWPRTASEPSQAAMAPSLVTTPVGGSSRFTVGDAIVDAGGDTSLGVATTATGTSLALTRGTIDCEVPPRPDRLPFRVIAGDVVVEVVGTRFAVARTGSRVRVDVTRGKVSITRHGVQRFVVAGESWSSEPAPLAATVDREATAVAKPRVADDATGVAKRPVPDPAMDATGGVTVAAPTPRRPEPVIVESRSAAFQSAQRLEANDPLAAMKAYRALANGTDRWAALALMNLAELHATVAPDAALRELEELQRRFPNGGNAEDAAWLRIEILRTTGRTDEARRAARIYVGTYPRGTYLRQATRMLQP